MSFIQHIAIDSFSDRSCPWFFISYEVALDIFPYFRRIYSPCKQTSKELLCCSSLNIFARRLWHSHKTTVYGYAFSKTDNKTQFKIWLYDTHYLFYLSVACCLKSRELFSARHIFLMVLNNVQKSTIFLLQQDFIQSD